MSFTDASLAEVSVAGAILLAAQEVLPTVRGIVQPGDFAEANARAVFRAAVDLDDNCLPVDVVTIQQRAAELGTPLSSEWLGQTMEKSVTAAFLVPNCEAVRAAAVNRESRDVGELLSEGGISPEEALERLQSALNGRRSTLPTPAEDAKGFYEALCRAARGESQTYLPTGFRSLDGLLGGGLMKSELITLAARPSVGKTAVALAVASNIAKAGGRVLYISLEMKRNQLIARRLASKTGVSSSRLLRGDVSEDWETIGRGLSELSDEQLIIWDLPCKLADIEIKTRAALPLDLLILDHMGIISDEKGEELQRYAAATKRSHRMKQLAQSLNIPVLMLCQLNRGVESRDNRRPRLSELRESGAIEEDSGAVLLLYREGYYSDPRPEPWEHEIIEINVAKNRYGQTGTVELDFVSMLTQVRDPGDGFVSVSSRTPFD